jgi:nucleotide-binding universal stress UspA family protein
MLKRILVGLGGTPYTTVAVKRAAELAKAHGAHITGVTVLDLKALQKGVVKPHENSIPIESSVRQKIAVTRSRVEASINRFEEVCSHAGIAFTIQREVGNAFDLMISHARHHDLTIFGLRSLFDYGITREPQNALIRLVSQGVRPILAVSTQYRPIRRALVAYSGSMESATAMRRFIQMGLWPDLEIEVVHFSTDAINDEKMLQEAAAYCRAHGYKTATHRADQAAHWGVLEQARQLEADIIVMGNSVRNLMFRQILGSAVLATIQNADRPIFLAQ